MVVLQPEVALSQRRGWRYFQQDGCVDVVLFAYRKYDTSTVR